MDVSGFDTSDLDVSDVAKSDDTSKSDVCKSDIRCSQMLTKHSPQANNSVTMVMECCVNVFMVSSHVVVAEVLMSSK